MWLKRTMEILKSKKQKSVALDLCLLEPSASINSVSFDHMETSAVWLHAVPVGSS